MTPYNKEYIMNLIDRNSSAWGVKHYLENNKLIIDDKDIALIVLEKDGLLLKFCQEDFKNDYDLVKIAVTNNGMALDYASEQLKNNDAIVKIAMKLNQAILFASDRIKRDKEFALLSLRINPSDIRFYSNEIRGICGSGGTAQEKRMQATRLKKVIDSEKFSHQLSAQLNDKEDTKSKLKI